METVILDCSMKGIWKSCYEGSQKTMCMISFLEHCIILSWITVHLQIHFILIIWDYWIISVKFLLDWKGC